MNKEQVQQRVDEILRTWFGFLSDDTVFPEDRMSLWFGADEAADNAIRRKFEKDLALAAAGKLDDWKKTRRGCFAFIIVLDQFSRMIYRNRPEAFKQDAKALEACLWGLERDYDRSLRPAERMFFYMPLEHSENLEMQKKSVALYAQLMENAPLSIDTHTSQAHQFALQHCQIIERFGRFPQRNRILGRASTPAELEFLKTPESQF